MMLFMHQVALKDKRVLIREDFNVPFTEQGEIAHSARIDAALPTIRAAMAQGAKVILMSHLGRPKEGCFAQEFSLRIVADYLSLRLGQSVALCHLEAVPNLAPQQVVLLENVRFLVGEQENSDQLAKKLATLCDVFVMDAFAVAHRAQASTVGVAKYAPLACCGPLLQQEIAAIEKVMAQPKSPVVAIVGGSKVSTKLKVLENLLPVVDTLVVGGGIANTFLVAAGYSVGESLMEEDLVATAKMLLAQAQEQGKQIWLPSDVVVALDVNQPQGQEKSIAHIAPEDKIFDIGVRSQQQLANIILSAKTILWNGPIGVFEKAPFAKGTQALAQAIAQSEAFSVAGGGDTLAAIEAFKVSDKISYLSTGGGAFLEVLEGKVLPALAVLQNHAQPSNLD